MNRSLVFLSLLLSIFIEPSFKDGFLFRLNSVFASDSLKKDVHEENQKILVIPRIKLIEKNSLKSYSWWEKEDPKVPNIYKLILNKLKDDFLLEKLDVEIAFKKINKDNMSEFENSFVVFGTLVLDSLNKSEHKLKDFSFYKIENGQLKFLMLSNTEDLDIKSNFRSIAVVLKEKINNFSIDIKPKNEADEWKPKNSYLIVFENELSYEELNQIRASIKEALNEDINNVKLLYSETKKYTFQVISKNNPFELLKKTIFVNGPYEFEVIENSLIFKPYTEEDVL
jgi:hypothetical protein